MHLHESSRHLSLIVKITHLSLQSHHSGANALTLHHISYDIHKSFVAFHFVMVMDTFLVDSYDTRILNSLRPGDAYIYALVN